MVSDSRWPHKINAKIEQEEQNYSENMNLFLYLKLNRTRNTSASLNKEKMPAEYYKEMNGWLYLGRHL